MYVSFDSPILLKAINLQKYSQTQTKIQKQLLQTGRSKNLEII